mmetsp:Transcript_26743/g.89535  ORF Transcript_26743/g.89535 Transcript_26743/m.89535 type:complete len:341 (-) Transcript_26743:983-2005(-)
MQERVEDTGRGWRGWPDVQTYLQEGDRIGAKGARTAGRKGAASGRAAGTEARAVCVDSMCGGHVIGMCVPLLGRPGGSRGGSVPPLRRGPHAHRRLPRRGRLLAVVALGRAAAAALAGTRPVGHGGVGHALGPRRGALGVLHHVWHRVRRARGRRVLARARSVVVVPLPAGRHVARGRRHGHPLLAVVAHGHVLLGRAHVVGRPVHVVRLGVVHGHRLRGPVAVVRAREHHGRRHAARVALVVPRVARRGAPRRAVLHGHPLALMGARLVMRVARAVRPVVPVGVIRARAVVCARVGRVAHAGEVGAPRVVVEVILGARVPGGEGRVLGARAPHATPGAA